jgi:hypothetical protein
VPVLLIGGLEAWKREFGVQELVVEQAPVVPPVSPPATEVYEPSSPQLPVPQLAPVSRTPPPGAAMTSPQPEIVRSLPPIPRGPLPPNRTKAGTESVTDSRPSPVPDSHPRHSLDQGPSSPRYGLFLKVVYSVWCADHVLPHSVAESNGIPSEPVRRIQRKPTMTRPPSVSPYPRTMSDGVRLFSHFWICMSSSH